MGLKGRIDRLEVDFHEAALRRRAEELAAEYGMDADQLMEEARQTHARLRMLKLMYPLAAAKDDEDMEPYLRMLADEEGQDPDEVMEEARRIAERRVASGQE